VRVLSPYVAPLPTRNLFMTRILLSAVAGALAALCLLPAASQAKASDLWATINVCDTKKHPDMLGVRARMPGNGKRERMFMRFTAQFRKNGHWKEVSGGRSKWLSAGSAQLEFQERGFTFPIGSPAKGKSFLLRGVAEFEWRKPSGRVTKRRRRVTEGGHHSTGADPAGFSAGKCRVETPAP
jgi:hypothetical protein